MGLVTCGLVNIGHRVTIQLHQTKDHIYIILINGLSEIHDKETDRRRKGGWAFEVFWTELHITQDPDVV